MNRDDKFEAIYSYVVVGFIALLFIASIGGGLISIIKDLGMSKLEKCQRDEYLTQSEYADEYCKEDGTVGDRVAEKKARDEVACNAKGAQWLWSPYDNGSCERIAYDTKQECKDAGLEGPAGDDGYYVCQDNGTTEFITEEALVQRTIQEVCNIKGNISYNTGERIYHLPGQLYYDETTINTDYGERWFCTEQEAINAGWRKAYE